METNMPIAMILGLHGVVPALLYWGGLMAFLVAAFWRPRYGLYFLIPLLPLQTVRYRLHELPLGEKFVDIMLLGVILGMIFRRDGTSFLKTPLNRFIAILAAFLYISLWHGSFYLRSEEHTSELQSQSNLVCRLLLEKKKYHKKMDSLY